MKLFAILALFSWSALAQETPQTIFQQVSSCSSKIEGAAVELEIFEEIDATSGKSTGRGQVFQAIKMGPHTMRFVSHAKVANKGNVKEIAMANVLEPKIEFSRFLLKNSGNTQVAIRDRSRGGAVWGKFSCDSQGSPEPIEAEKESAEDPTGKSAE